jgi:hypothetical protein
MEAWMSCKSISSSSKQKRIIDKTPTMGYDVLQLGNYQEVCELQFRC